MIWRWLSRLFPGDHAKNKPQQPVAGAVRTPVSEWARRISPKAPESEFLGWAVVANIIDIERAGKEPDRLYSGTPVFAPNCKLHLGKIYWGSVANAHFVGQNRKTKRMSNAVVALHLVHNYRVKSVYSPALERKLEKLDAELFLDREEADELCKQAGYLSRKERERMPIYQGIDIL